MQSKIENRKSKISAPIVSAERVRAYIRSRFNPIRSLTPDLLSQYLDAFKVGYLRQAALVWDVIAERDDTLAAVIPKRKAAAARHGWEILTLDSIADSLKKEADAHKAALNAFYNNLTVTNAIDENERGEVSLLLRQMMSAVGMRYAVHEICWRPGVDNQQSAIRNQQYLTADFRFTPLWFFENTTGRLRYLQSEGAIDGVDMADESWLICVNQGLMPACSVAYMYKTMSLHDWVIYNERHGMPGIHGKTDAAKDSDEWQDLVTAVQNFAADWAIVTNTGASVEKVDMAATGQLPYPPLVERMDRAMAALWRGADLSTLSAGQGQGQGASLQGAESETLEEDDAQWLSENLSRQLDRQVIAWHFGEGVRPLAYIKIKTSQKKDTAIELQVDAFLRDSGAPVGVKSVLERYNRPLPAEDEPILSAPVAPDPTTLNPQPSTIPRTPHAPATPPAHTPSGDDARHVDKTGVPPAPGSAGSLANQKSEVRGQQSAIRNHQSQFADHPAIGELLAAARMELAAAQDQVLQPLRAELEKVLQAPDSDLQAQLSDLKARLPDLLRRINADPATAQVIEGALSAALLNGLVEKP